MSRYQTDSLFQTEQAEPGTHIIRVAFESAVDNEFDYFVPERLWPIQAGQRVEAPFGRTDKRQIGFCVDSDIPFDRSFAARDKKRTLKKVSNVIDKNKLIDTRLMELARWLSQYYVCPLGQVLAAMVPGAVKRAAGTRTEKYVYLSEAIDETVKALKGKKQKLIVKYLQQKKALASKNAVRLQDVLLAVDCKNSPVKKLAEKQIVKIVEKTILKSLPAIPQAMAIKTDKVILNDDQQKALNSIKDRLNSEKFSVAVLHGVTDSGKTEIYIRAVELCLKNGKSAIVLLPEIALTAQTVQRFSDRFKKIAVMHSQLTASQRNAQWQKIKTADADVVIGARSAVFAPLPKLGLVIVDEEHDATYKQDTVPRYNARDVAVKRAQLENALCILGSATPSLETLFNARTKKHFTLLNLPKRVMNVPMPEMKLVDLRGGFFKHKEMNLISEPLAEHLKNVLEKNEQAILLLNRRGYSNFVFCPSCKYTLQCRNCDVTLTFHRSKIPRSRMQILTGKLMDYGFAMCHYCGAQTLVPEKCPLCDKGMAMIGLGSQRLEAELARKFPHARVSRVDSDSMAGKDYYHVLKDFSDGRLDILAGTQMLAKGLHFPNVTLVGIISADTSLYLPDFRANERTFQLISHVAGRAGRSLKKGIVFVQTFLPDQPAIQFSLDGDFNGFIKEELKHRKACNLPPFWRLAAVIIKGRNFDKLQNASKAIREKIDDILTRNNLKAIVRGPMPAVISRIQRFHRMQIIIQTSNAETMQKLFATLRKEKPLTPAVNVAINIDPINLL